MLDRIFRVLVANNVHCVQIPPAVRGIAQIAVVVCVGVPIPFHIRLSANAHLASDCHILEMIIPRNADPPGHSYAASNCLLRWSSLNCPAIGFHLFRAPIARKMLGNEQVQQMRHSHYGQDTYWIPNSCCHRKGNSHPPAEAEWAFSQLLQLGMKALQPLARTVENRSLHQQEGRIPRGDGRYAKPLQFVHSPPASSPR